MALKIKTREEAIAVLRDMVKRKKEAPLKIMAHSKNGGENGRKRCYNI